MEYEFDKGNCNHFEEHNICKRGDLGIALGLKPAPRARRVDYSNGKGYDKYQLPEGIELCRGCVCHSGREGENIKQLSEIGYKLGNPLRENHASS